jgi:hypothetical protein
MSCKQIAEVIDETSDASDLYSVCGDLLREISRLRSECLNSEIIESPEFKRAMKEALSEAVRDIDAYSILNAPVIVYSKYRKPGTIGDALENAIQEPNKPQD